MERLRICSIKFKLLKWLAKMKGVCNMNKKTIAGMACLLTAALVGLAGCGSSATDTAATAVTSDYAMRDSAEAGFYSESKAVNEAAAESTQISTNRKLIKTVNMDVETENFEDLNEILYQKVESLGGYVESFSTQGQEGYRSSSMTARIPKNNLETFLETVEGSSNITYRQEEVEDVTLAYVDLESHKKMLQKEQDRLLELLEEAETIEDIITLESRLTEVQYQLESMESQLRTYDNQVDYSTVYLNIDEVERYTPQEPKGAWEQIKTGFCENLYAVGRGLKNFFIGFVVNIPFLIVWLVIILIFALIIRGCLRLEKKNTEKKKREKQAQYVGMQQQKQTQNQPQNVQKDVDQQQ